MEHRRGTAGPSDMFIVEKETDVARPKPIASHKIGIIGGPLSRLVARQHALQADADALDIVDRAPSLLVKQVEAYDAIAVDVGVEGHLVRGKGGAIAVWWGVLEEDDLGSLDGIVGGKGEGEEEGFGVVDGVIGVEDLQRQVPGAEVGGG